MRPEFSTGLILILLGGCVWSASAQGVPGRGRPIEFSDSKVLVVTSNLNSAAHSRKGSLRTLDDQFKAPFNLLDSADLLDGNRLSTPLLRAPTLTPQAAKQLLEKKREDEQWIFGTPEELEARRLSAERMFGVTEFNEDGTEVANQSPLQRYWERTDREKAGVTNRLSADIDTQKSDQEIKEQAKAMFGILNLPSEGNAVTKGPVVRNALSPAYANPFSVEASPMRSGPDLFAGPAPAFNFPKNEAAANRMNEFKQLFDSKPVASGLGGSAPSSYSRPASAADYGSASGSSWRPPSVSSASSFNPLSGSSLSRPPSATPVTGLKPTLPPAQPSLSVSQPKAGFQVPKRTF